MDKNKSKKNLLEKNLSLIPKKYEVAYRYIHKNIYHIDTQNKKLFNVELFNQYRQFSIRSSNINTELIIQHPNSTMFDEFYKYNKLEGKRDASLLGTSIDEILKLLVIQKLSKGSNTQINDLVTSLEKIKNIFILTDIAISGNTLNGEISGLINIFKYIGLPRHSYAINCLILYSTKSVIKLLDKRVDNIFTITQIPDEASIINESFKTKCTINYSDIINLQQWFSKNIVSEGSRLSKMAQIIGSKRILELGYNEQGWLIVSDLNTPNNTLPLLWYNEHNTYQALYPRTSSRLYENPIWNLRNSLFNLLKK